MVLDLLCSLPTDIESALISISLLSDVIHHDKPQGDFDQRESYADCSSGAPVLPLPLSGIGSFYHSMSGASY